MEKNNVTNSENIHVKVDQNNLIYIDPNSSIDGDGNISPRNIQAEKLVMYVNLEADIVPRSILVSDNQTNTLTSIASGTLNFLKNQDGQDYDTTWTDSFLTTQQKKNGKGEPTGEFFQSDKSGQSFGIESISIKILGFNAIPQITVNFIDVRGKTLFESPENSPYKAFFHIPWPIFYLTVKGYYGKAIKYRLHLVKFTSKFNEGNGNFEVSTSFVGSTYAWLSDIPLQGILNAAYLFPIESSQITKENTNTGLQLEEVKKSSRGYEILKTVYSEYKSKGFIPNDFPVKTVKEVLTIATNLDSLLEKQIFDQVVDMRLFAAIKEFGETIDEFETASRAWAKENLVNTPVNLLNKTLPDGTVIQYYYINNEDKTITKQIFGEEKDGSLEHLLKKYKDKIEANQMFTNFLTSKPQQPSLINNTNSVFSKNTLGINKLDAVSGYTTTDDQKFNAVAIDDLVNDVREIKRNFEQQRDKLEKGVEKKMNEIVKNKKNGFGFDPTIRNIFAIILANAEVLIRLMKDVHRRAFEQADTRKKIVGEFSKESNGESIYPWPELKASVLGKQNTIIYPGDPDFHIRLGSDNPVRWPEVDFIETYIGVATNKVDSLSNKEGGINITPDQLQNDQDVKKIKKISTANTITNVLPYVNKIPSSFVYEIYERASTYTLIDSFSTETIKELAKVEYQNILESVNGENSLRKLLRENVRSVSDILAQLEKLAPHDSYNYYLDSLPTTDYLKSFYSQSYTIEQYKKSYDFNDTDTFKKLQGNIFNYRVQDYRTKIYPFSSKPYLSYLNLRGKPVDNFGIEYFFYQGFLEIDTTQGLISGKKDPNFWVKSGYSENLFSCPIIVDKNKTNILNTPYFHKQLYADFNDRSVNGSNGRYTASAYLFLNSLPFVELDEHVNYEGGEIFVSTLFNEVSSSQYVPYFLILKWGSIYHRYKKYILNGKDILSDQKDDLGNILKEGCITTGLTSTRITGETTGFTTTNINGAKFFDNSYNLVFMTNTGMTPVPVQYSGKTNVGLHPNYDNIFHTVVNGSGFFDFVSGNTTGYTTAITGGKLNLKKYDTRGSEELNYWTQYIYNGTDQYTLLPSAGGNLHYGKMQSVINTDTPFSDNGFLIEDQNNYRIIWEDEYINNVYSGKTFFSPIEYNRNVKNLYSLSNNNKKVMDLIATFNPQILEDFETYFLNFASEKLNLNVPEKPFELTKYSKFQEILADIVNITKGTNDSNNVDTQIQNLKVKQVAKLKNITSSLINNNDLIKITIGNPKELDPHILNGFIDINKTNRFKYKPYNETNFNQSYIDLYLGKEPEVGSYKSFFINNDVEFSEANVLMFRSLVYIYAGYVNNGGYPNKDMFKTYLFNNIISETNGGSYNRMVTFLDTLLPLFKSFNVEEPKSRIKFFDGYNNKALKVELYNFFKSMNDKWIAGNSIGHRSLMEEFLFLDKANKDIGNDYYIDISRLVSIADEKNTKQNLYSMISMLLQDTGFDMRALPAYINFYGTNFSTTPKLTPSKKIAQNLFGTFLEVDYQESSPKIIIQYVGKNSVRPDMESSNKYKFTDDSYNIGNTNNNPVMITLPKVFKTGDLAKTNKVVAFEVSFGDQNQSIFKGITLDQASIKNTTESFYVLENLSRSESGSASYNVDIGLFEYYRQAAYTCDITCMGNVMIQPTMFFYLKNIPMFKGTYWITEVSHEIRNNNIVTHFKGSRMPYTALPDLSDSFMSSYRTLFDKLQQKATNRVNGSDKVTTTSRTMELPDGSQYTYDMGPDVKKVPGENVTIGDVGVTVNGIPYNGYDGFRYIAQVEYKNSKWLRAQVVKMGGANYSMSATNTMSLIANSDIKPNPAFTWENIEKFKDKYYFYSTRFISSKMKVNDTLEDYHTLFLNPSNSKKMTLPHAYALDKTKQTPIVFGGPIDNIRDEKEYGIAMSPKLMKDLDLHDGDIVYFKLEKV